MKKLFQIIAVRSCPTVVHFECRKSVKLPHPPPLHLTPHRTLPSVTLPLQNPVQFVPVWLLLTIDVYPVLEMGTGQRRQKIRVVHPPWSRQQWMEVSSSSVGDLEEVR
ncbi:hypothetical protein J6590_079555 [Homalodisca vitripennis]|nr:hypothetical protein J6590_079555 [Homalodisca vitripennis]